MFDQLSSEKLFAEKTLFSQVAVAGELIFLAQDARTSGASVRKTDTTEEQAVRIVENLGVALKTIELDLQHLISMNVFLTDYADMPRVLEFLWSAFPEPKKAFPATTFVGVMSLEGNCRLRIDAVATTIPDREPFTTPGVPLPFGGQCHGVRAGELFFLSGVDAGDRRGTVGNSASVEAQTHVVLEKLEAILKSQDLSLAEICRTFMFLPGTQYRLGYTDTRKKHYKNIFRDDEFPPNSGIYVKDLGEKILLRSIAIATTETQKSIVTSSKVRTAPGLFSQATRVGNWVFVAGQDAIGFNREVEALGNLAGQTEVSLRHIKDIVEAAGGSLNDVVKTTVYLVAGQDRSVFAEAYKKFFAAHGCYSKMPAGLTLEVRELAPSCLVEIDAVALLEN